MSGGAGGTTPSCTVQPPWSASELDGATIRITERSRDWAVVDCFTGQIVEYDGFPVHRLGRDDAEDPAEIFNDLDALRLATGNPRRQFLSKGRQLGGARGARPRHFAPLPHIGRRGENPMCNRFCSINDWSEVPRLLLTGRRLDFEFNPERGVDRTVRRFLAQPEGPPQTIMSRFGIGLTGKGGKAASAAARCPHRRHAPAAVPIAS